jgi:hypothetical protein
MRAADAAKLTPLTRRTAGTGTMTGGHLLDESPESVGRDRGYLGQRSVITGRLGDDHLRCWVSDAEVLRWIQRIHFQEGPGGDRRLIVRWVKGLNRRAAECQGEVFYSCCYYRCVRWHPSSIVG